jgi:cell division protein ZapA
MKQVEVTILDQSYMLGCPEGGELQLQAAVKAVDREMTAIRSAGKVKARERIAVLAALNLAFALEQRPAGGVADAAANGVAGPQAAQIDALISRIDEALSESGQLL